jgi:hypothetical protein
MRRLARTLTAVALAGTAGAAVAASGHAAPGDPVALRGTLAWPAALSAEPFVVVRADDGRFYYVDASRAERGQVLRVGERVSVLGIEGSRAWEVAAVALAPGDAALLAPLATGEPAASPPTEVAPARPRPAQLWERIDGTVQALRGHTLAVRATDGRTVTVDLGRLGAGLGRDLPHGTPVTVFAVSERGRRIAVGLVRTDPGN